MKCRQCENELLPDRFCLSCRCFMPTEEDIKEETRKIRKRKDKDTAHTMHKYDGYETPPTTKYGKLAIEPPISLDIRNY